MKPASSKPKTNQKSVYLDLLARLEAWQRQGQSSLLREQLAKLQVSDIPRPLVGQFARLARRTGMYDLSLRILKPIVRPLGGELIAASDEEKSEYAATLLRFGAIYEARGLLNSVDESKYPLCQLYQALSHIRQWEYKSALAPLNSFLLSVEPTSYDFLVARVNKLSINIYLEKFSEVQEDLERLRETCLQQGHLTLAANTFELQSQMLYLQRSFLDAQACAQKGLAFISGNRNLNDLFLRKWEAFSSCQLDNKLFSEKIPALRERARRLWDFETLRECDTFEALLFQNEYLLRKVIFGTPFPEYRSWLVQSGGSWLSALPQSLVITPGEGQPVDEVIDFSAWKWRGQSLPFPPGQTMARALVRMLQDTYCPPQLGELFSFVHPEEYFDPTASRARLNFTIHQIRKTLIAENLPIQITVTHGYLRARPASKEVGFRIPLDWRSKAKSSTHMILWETFLAQHSRKAFTSSDLVAVLKVSETKAVRLLRWLKEQKLIEKRGSGPKTHYEIRQRSQDG